MTVNTLTNIVGAVGVAAGAATPVLSAVNGASLHQGDYFQLVLAVCFAVVSFFTGKKVQ